MEPRDRAAEKVAWRFRLVAVCLGLVALAFVQAPGRMITDTKLDLTIAPGRFLARALTLWDPVGAFGQVQNQAYGYLFPMGPFFWLGHLAEVDPWVVQRLWWALLFVTAFLGMVKLSSSLGIGAPWARIVAALAYTLSPRIVSVIGPSSIEVWPMALAPWVLVPLVVGSRRGDPRRMAAASALAVACVGGVNAVATFAVLPLGALWLLLQPPSRRRRSLMLWWPVFVVAGTLWWLGPLLLLGHYSPPFLDFIESASTTTFAATAFDAMRGTSDWVPYIDGNSIAGNRLLTSTLLILNSLVVMVVGLLGVVRRDNRHRTFLFGGVVLGLVLLTLGHTGAVQGWGALSVQQALDAALAPMRNTHKFDLVLRIPLALGLAHLVSALAPQKLTDVRRPLAAGVAVLTVSAVLGSTVPAWTAQLPNTGTFSELPGYWRQASGWLDHRATADDRRALLLPASGFGDYLWGRTGDEPLQPLADKPWAVRNSIPLAPGGNIDMLDTVERRIETGQGSAAFADYLRRSGIGFLVVRNDIRWPGGDSIDPEVVHAALASTPGVRRVASFGPKLGGPASVISDDGTRTFIDHGFHAEHPAVEIFEVGSARQRSVSAQSLATTPVVVGGADSLLRLHDLGVVGDESTLLSSDVPAGMKPGRIVLSDGSRRQETAFGRVHDNRSASLGRNDPYSLTRRVHSYTDAPDSLSVPRLIGATAIRASSSQSDASTPSQIVQADSPWAAFDGDPRTAWHASAADIGGTSWLELELGGPTEVQHASITLQAEPTTSRTVVVATDAGSVRKLLQGGVPTQVTLPAGPTTRLRISAPASSFDLLSIADVTIPGLQISRPLVLPAVPSAWGDPDQIVLSADDAYRSGCAPFGRLTQCVPSSFQWGEDGRTLDRELALHAARTYATHLTIAPLGGTSFDDLVQQGRGSAVTASSQEVGGPQRSPVLAIDGNRATGWVADADDPDPTLTLRWVRGRTISKIRVRTNSSLAASKANELVLRFSGGQTRTVTLVDGRGTFAPVPDASFVEVHFTKTLARKNSDPFGTVSTLPVGVSEIRLQGRALFPQPPSTSPVTYPCGSGPTVAVDDDAHATSFTASPADLLTGRTMSATVCGAKAVSLAKGSHRITITGTGAVRPDALVLGPDATPAMPIEAAPTRWGTTSRTVRLGAGSGAQLLTVQENQNAGWAASTPGASAVAATVDGWQQGWIVPSGRRDLDLHYGPNTTYRASLVIGLLAFLALLAGVLLLRDVRAAEPARRARVRTGRLVGLGLTLLAVGTVGGLLGVAAAAAGWAAAVVVARWFDEAASWAAGVALTVAGLAYLARPWGGSQGWAGDLAWPHLLVLTSVGAGAASVFGGTALLRRRRIDGFSTRR